MIRNGRPRARFAAQIARYSKRPVRRSTPTMIIMPSSRKMTFQSMPLSSEKNGVSSVAPMTSISAAPPARPHPVHPLGGDEHVRGDEDEEREPDLDRHRSVSSGPSTGPPTRRTASITAGSVTNRCSAVSPPRRRAT